MEKILAYIKEQQKEYHEHTSAYKVLRKLEAELPGLFSAPSPSQVLEEKVDIDKFIYDQFTEEYRKQVSFEFYLKHFKTQDEFVKRIALGYSTLQTQQLQNRVKELEEQLSVMPTRKHQIVSEVVELREQVKQASNESYKKTIKLAESISFNTEDQSGNKFIAVNLDELIEKITSTSKLLKL